MTTTTQEMQITNIPLDRLKVKSNVRIGKLKGIAQMTASIKRIGIQQPLLVEPAEDGKAYYIVDGHRRHAGAKTAGLTAAPCIIHSDWDLEAVRLEAQLAANMQRDDLTAMEEALAYERLTLAGMSDVDIAAATGKPKAQVVSRRKLTKLPEDTQSRIGSGQITIEEAEMLVPFAKDEEALAWLDKHIGTGSLKWKVREWPAEKRRRKERKDKQAAARKERDELKQRQAEAKAAGKPIPKAPAKKAAPPKDDWKAQEAKRAARRKDIEERAAIAKDLRLPWVEAYVAGALKVKAEIPDGLLGILRATAHGIISSPPYGAKAIFALTGIDPKKADVTKLTNAQILVLLCLRISELDDDLTRAYDWTSSNGADVMHQLVTFMGYEPSKEELELVKEHKKKQ